MMGSRNRDDFFADCIEPASSHCSTNRDRELNEEASSSENAFERQQDGTQIVIFNITSNHTDKDVEDFLTSIVEKVECGSLWTLKVKNDKKSSNLKFSYATFNTPEVAKKVVEIINSDEFPMTGIDKGMFSHNRLYAKVHVPKQGGYNHKNRQNFFDVRNGLQNSRFNNVNSRQFTHRQADFLPDERGGFSAEIIPESINLPFFTVIKNGFRLDDLQLEKLSPLQITSHMLNSTCIYLEECTSEKKVIPKLAVLRVPNPNPFGYSEIELIGGEMINAFNRKLCSTPGNSEIVNCELKGYGSKNPELCKVLLKQYLKCRNQIENLCRIIPLGSGEPVKVKLYKDAEDATIDFINILEDLNLIDGPQTYQNANEKRESIMCSAPHDTFKFKSPSKIREFVPSNSGHPARRSIVSPPTLQNGQVFAPRGVVFKPPSSANKPIILQRGSSGLSPLNVDSQNSRKTPSDQNDISSTQPVTEKTSTTNETSSITSSEVGSLIFEHDETTKFDSKESNPKLSSSQSPSILDPRNTDVPVSGQEERVVSPISDNLSMASSVNSKLSEISLNAPEIVKESERFQIDGTQNSVSGKTHQSCSSPPSSIIYSLPLPKEPKISVKITYVNHLFFWAQPVESAVEFWTLEKALLGKIDHIRPVGTVTVGSFVTAIYREKVYRAVYLGDRVVKTHTSITSPNASMHCVYFIDYGQIELVNVISLNRPKEFWDLPAQAIPFTECGEDQKEDKQNYLKLLEGQIVDINLHAAKENESIEMRTLALAFGDDKKTASDDCFKYIPSAFLPSLKDECSNPPSETEL